MGELGSAYGNVERLGMIGLNFWVTYFAYFNFELFDLRQRVLFCTAPTCAVRH